MMTDALLAILHHIAVVSLIVILAMEFALVQPGLSGRTLDRVARLDRAYGLIAVIVIAIGISRVVFGLKGWDAYATNWAFWGKMASIAAIAVLSVPPTLRFIAWQREARQAGQGHVVPAGEIAAVRRCLHLQLALLVPVLVFAAVMARGIGY